MLQESSLAVDVNGSADLPSDLFDFYTFSKKSTVFVVEIVHTAISRFVYDLRESETAAAVPGIITSNQYRQ
jgi:hypothetical protein